MSKVLKTRVQETKQLAKQLSATLTGGEILALSGPLGSGKTTFTKALAKQLGVKRHVTSPTFVLMNVYPGRLKTSGKKRIHLYHLDLYRCKDFREVSALGITEVWGKPDTITVLEWADKIKAKLPKNALPIHFAPNQPL